MSKEPHWRGCTDLSAAWCPVCGNCICDREEDMSNPDCPLHAPDSSHRLPSPDSVISSLMRHPELAHAVHDGLTDLFTPELNTGEGYTKLDHGKWTIGGITYSMGEAARADDENTMDQLVRTARADAWREVSTGMLHQPGKWLEKLRPLTRKLRRGGVNNKCQAMLQQLCGDLTIALAATRKETF